MKKLSFSYDPMHLTRLSLQIHMEKKYNANEAFPKSVRFAVFEFLDSMDDTELEALLQEYVDAEDVKEITLEQHDRERLEHYLLNSERYQALVFENQQQGHDGLGVADLLTKTFTPCVYAHHWDALGSLLKEHHGDYGKAFERLMYNNDTEYAGVTEADMNKFIMTNFRFVGSQRLKNKQSNLCD